MCLLVPHKNNWHIGTSVGVAVGRHSGGWLVTTLVDYYSIPFFLSGAYVVSPGPTSWKFFLSLYLSVFNSVSKSNRNAIEPSRTIEVSCICTLSAFYHMAKQHTKGVSTQATDGTTVKSSAQYRCTYSCPRYCPWAPTTQIHFIVKNRADILVMSIDTTVVAMTYFKQ